MKIFDAENPKPFPKPLVIIGYTLAGILLILFYLGFAVQIFNAFAGLFY